MLCYYRRYKMESKKVDEGLMARLRAIVGDDGMVARDTELLVYECDGYTLERAVPQVVVLPRSTRQVSDICRLLYRAQVAFVPRGAGTGLSGGCLPLDAPVMICTSRMKRIIEIDTANRRAVVE